jgi:hypothetical protein
LNSWFFSDIIIGQYNVKIEIPIIWLLATVNQNQIPEQKLASVLNLISSSPLRLRKIGSHFPLAKKYFLFSLLYPHLFVDSSSMSRGLVILFCFGFACKILKDVWTCVHTQLYAIVLIKKVIVVFCRVWIIRPSALSLILFWVRHEFQCRCV